jgi:hypothetical protein
MKKWRERMRQKRKNKNHGERYSIVDLMLELLIWIPEVLFFPFRILFWLMRGIGKIIGDIWW